MPSARPRYVSVWLEDVARTGCSCSGARCRRGSSDVSLRLVTARVCAIYSRVLCGTSNTRKIASSYGWSWLRHPQPRAYRQLLIRCGQTSSPHLRSPQPLQALTLAKKVIIVPGYGLAVASAQATVADLVATLRKNGVDVKCELNINFLKEGIHTLIKQ